MKTIKSKLLAIFILIFAVIITNSIFAIINFSTLKNSIDNILKANYESVIYAQNMAIAIERQDSAELTLMFEENNKNAQQIFKDNEKEFLKLLSKAEGNITEKGEDKIIANLNTLYEEYLSKFNNLEIIQNENTNQGMDDYYYNEIFPLFEKIKAECRNLLNVNQEHMVVLKNTSEIIADRATYITIIISSITIIISFILIIYLINKIIKPIRDLIEKIRNISEGKYSQQLNIVGKDEIASLAAEFNIMASKLGAYELLNIKQLMKEKQKIEAIVESISDGIVVMGAENRILLINKAAEKIFKIKEKEVLKKHFLEVIKNDELFNFYNNVKNENYASLTKDYLDISIKSMSRINYYRALAKPITNIEGESIGVVLLLQDITKFKEVDELKSEFVASVSHELRTPITSVMMAAELLQNEIPGKVNKSQKELLKIVVEDSNRLKNLINDVLDLSKLESGKTTLDIRKNDLAKIINYVLKILGMQIKEENINIKIELKKNLPPILCDYSKISQVLTNLIINSINYKIENKVLILKIGAKAIKGNKVLVYLSDNGRGITEEDQKKIFDKFVRIDTYNKNNEGTTQGAGLGLTISKSIIKSHKGDIWVESEIGKGSTFYFTLDAAKKINKNPIS